MIDGASVIPIVKFMSAHIAQTIAVLLLDPVHIECKLRQKEYQLILGAHGTARKL